MTKRIRTPAKTCGKCGAPCWHASKHCQSCRQYVAHNKKPAVVLTCPLCGTARSYPPSKAALRKGPSCGKCSKRRIGSANPNWKGGRRTHNAVLRASAHYKLWRKTVFERDNYTCQGCGQRGGELHADHIKPFAYFPRLRFDVNNGRTLCKPCHEKTDTYQFKVFKYRKPVSPLPLFGKAA